MNCVATATYDTLVPLLVCTSRLLLTGTEAEGRGCLVHGEDKNLGNVNVRRARCGPDDLLGDVFGHHFEGSDCERMKRKNDQASNSQIGRAHV